MIKLKEEDLKKVPFEKWHKMLKETYNIELLEIRHFLIGYEDPYLNEADNGFLELSCFCHRLNQTSVDVSEEMYRVYILGEGKSVKKKVIIALETEVEVSSILSDEAVMKVAFPEIVLDENLSNKIIQKMVGKNG
jgi:hypothetical protein